MLDVYYGEFTVSPVPLELSLNYCSHACAYCFANLNHPDRDTKIKDVMQLLTHAHTRKGIDAVLLREGFPVLISNRTDAFANSNYKQALPLMRMLADMGVPMAIQTKGGRGIDEAMSFMQPSCWYISLAFEDDVMRQAIEPGAPSIHERLALMEQLTKAGHTVYLGLNPLVPEWMPHPEKLLRRVKDAGVYGVWIELLHLNRNQVEAMTDKERAAMTNNVLARAQGKLAVDEDSLRQDAFAYAREIGLETYCLRQTYPSRYWEPYRKLYAHTFPTHQDFVNWCHANKKDGDSVSFAEYKAVMMPGLPSGEHRIENYIRVPNRALFLKENIPAVMSYERLLRYAWNDARLWFAPVRIGNFAYAGGGEFDKYGVSEFTYTDDNDDPYMIWDPSGNLDCAFVAANPI